jgi:hypothetical protein
MARKPIWGKVRNQISNECQRIRRELPDRLAEADKRTALDVAVRAQARALGMGGVYRHAAPAIIPTGVDQVSLHAGIVPVVLAAEYGRDRLVQFGPFIGGGLGAPGRPAGHMLTPTLAADEALDRYRDALAKVLG